MNHDSNDFQSVYREAIKAHLRQPSAADSDNIKSVAAAASAAKITTPKLSVIHETTLALEILPNLTPKQRSTAINRSSHFLAALLASIAKSRPGQNQLHQDIASLSRHGFHHFETIRKSHLEINRRKDVETALRTSRSEANISLRESERLKKQLQHLSRQVLTSQEEERKKISRELHDVVAQALVGINIRLATLKKVAALNARGLERNIAATQRIVAKSADIVHQFARELRPTVLDDLGLIPALRTYLETFTVRTGIHTHLAACAGIEELGINQRTALFRVTQEALTNIARHSRASSAHITIHKKSASVSLTVKDDGKSFAVRKAFLGQSTKRLGLIGMRERIEMIGGIFNIESSPGHGTSIHAEIPWPAPKTGKTSQQST